MIDERRLLVLCFPGGLLCLVHPYVYENKRSKSMKLFAQILVKFTWHFWNQLHLGIYSAPPLLDRACDISRCFYSCFWKALFPLEFTLVSDTIRFRKQDMPIIAFQRCLSQMLTFKIDLFVLDTLPSNQVHVLVNFSWPLSPHQVVPTSQVCLIC